jgi:hypothetical protein
MGAGSPNKALPELKMLIEPVALEEALRVYVPTPPEPVPNAVTYEPAVIPVPLTYCPNTIGSPESKAVIVRVVVETEPANTASVFVALVPI